MCVYMYVYIYIYIYKHIQLCTYVCIYMLYVDTFIHLIHTGPDREVRRPRGWRDG